VQSVQHSKVGLIFCSRTHCR